MIQIYKKILKPFHLKKERKENQPKEIISSPTLYEELYNIYEKYQKKSILEDNYYLLGSDFFKKIIEKKRNLENIQDLLIPILKNWDESEIKIPLELGMELERKVNNQDTILGIHRTGSIFHDNPKEDYILQKIMEEGLINNGDSMQGFISKNTPNPNKTVSACNNILDIVLMIKSSYKDSKGAILLEFPRTLVEKDLSFSNKDAENKIYDYHNQTAYIKPEFILGYIQKGTNEKPCTYFTKEQLTEYQSKKQA